MHEAKTLVVLHWVLLLLWLNWVLLNWRLSKILLWTEVKLYWTNTLLLLLETKLFCLLNWVLLKWTEACLGPTKLRSYAWHLIIYLFGCLHRTGFFHKNRVYETAWREIYCSILGHANQLLQRRSVAHEKWRAGARGGTWHSTSYKAWAEMIPYVLIN